MQSEPTYRHAWRYPLAIGMGLAMLVGVVALAPVVFIARLFEKRMPVVRHDLPLADVAGWTVADQPHLKCGTAICVGVDRAFGYAFAANYGGRAVFVDAVRSVSGLGAAHVVQLGCGAVDTIGDLVGTSARPSQIIFARKGVSGASLRNAHDVLMWRGYGLFHKDKAALLYVYDGGSH